MATLADLSQVMSLHNLTIELTTPVLERVARMICSLDANHLACADVAFATGIRDGLTVRSLVSADRRLLAAAQHLGLPVDNPENHP